MSTNERMVPVFLPPNVASVVLNSDRRTFAAYDALDNLVMQVTMHRGNVTDLAKRVAEEAGVKLEIMP